MIVKPIDTHVHLDRVPEPPAAVERAMQAGLGGIVAVGMDLEGNRVIKALAARFTGQVMPAYGAHPWSLAEETWPANLEFLRQNLPEAAALGEVGLDYRYGVDKKLQRRVLSELLPLAAEFGKPVSFHCLYAFKRSLSMLKEAGVGRAVFHWYSGPLDFLDEILAAGYLVSDTPALAYSRSHRAALARTPLDRILVETDAPEEYQGRPSEPAQLLTTISLLADLKQLTPEQTAESTLLNARAFFGL